VYSGFNMAGNLGATTASQATLSPQVIRSQLDRILGHEIFSRSERLSRFLRYVVEETLAGRGAELKEPVLAAELYGKKVDSKSGDDSTVRVDARRLRDKLREYYGECARDPVIVTLPKGGYTPVFERNPSAPVPVSLPATTPIQQEQAVAPRFRWNWRVLAAGAALLGVVAYVAIRLSRRDSAPEVWRPVPISLLPGPEGSPSLSPDGNLVAFTWAGSAKPGQTDIYMRPVSGEPVRRLTETPASELTPAWSPDGNYIAFVRAGQGVFIMSQLGGSERRISQTGQNPAWTPDSQSVLIRDRVGERPAGIFQVSLETLERRQITQPTSGAGDWKFAVSPDGKTLAFDRSRRLGVSDVYVVSMSGGEPVRRTNWNGAMGGVVWTQDSRELIYNVGYDWPMALWRIPARGAKPERGRPVLLPMAIAASFPSISRPGPGRPARLAFQTGRADISLRLIDLDTPRSGEEIQGVKPLCDSSIVDYPGAFSPDASRVVFTSARSGRAAPGGLAGAPQLWIANRDGTGLRQLTTLDSPEVRHPAWSPDGQRITFEASVNGNTDVHLISPEGGQPRRLTREDSIDTFPSWSQDGKWIYFSSDRSGTNQIWKLPASGGQPVQVTRNGGAEPIESLDGTTLYYVDVRAGQPWTLKQVPVRGGEEKMLLDRVPRSHWAVTEKGIIFLRGERDFDVLHMFHPTEATVKLIGRLPFRIARIGDIGRFTVSRDGRWVLTHELEGGVDGSLMMIDGFR
jgi:Tol biopolymer transport system component